MVFALVPINYSYEDYKTEGGKGNKRSIGVPPKRRRPRIRR